MSALEGLRRSFHDESGARGMTSAPAPLKSLYILWAGEFPLRDTRSSPSLSIHPTEAGNRELASTSSLLFSLVAAHRRAGWFGWFGTVTSASSIASTGSCRVSCAGLGETVAVAVCGTDVNLPGS